jgi:hypothetical protein
MPGKVFFTLGWETYFKQCHDKQILFRTVLLALARTLSASLQKSMNETGERLDGLTAAQSNLSSGKIVSLLERLSHRCSEQPQF